MSRFRINTSYFMHSNPEYNKKHKEEISKYNAEYYKENKEKWQDNDSDSKSGSEDEKDSKDKKKSESKEKEKKMPVLNGGSKKGGSATGKKSSSKKSSTDKKSTGKKKETEEEKQKREAEEKAEQERQQEEERKKNSEYAEQLKKFQEETFNEKKLKELQNANKEWEKQHKKKKAIKHSAVYVGINSQPYFEHHGRLGMKWGKRNGPPYPLDYSKLSEEERAKDKARVKEEGDIESVGYKKNRSYFTDQEINEVINRYQLNTRINQLSAESTKMKAGKSKTDEMLDKMAKVADAGNKLSNALNAGTNVYNNVAKIMNAFGDADLPIVGQQKPKKEFKATKKELDKLIDNLEKGMGNMSNQEMQDALKRKTMFDQLTKDRDAKRASDKQAEIDKQNAEYEAYNEKLRRDAEEAAKFESGKYRYARR